MQALQKNKIQEIRALELLIVQRKRYHREQEVLIKDLVDSGNTQLMGLHHDILLAKQVLRDIKTDIRTAAQDKALLNEDLELIQLQAQVIVGPTMFIGFSPAF